MGSAEPEDDSTDPGSENQITQPERGMSLIRPVCFCEYDAFVGDRLDD